MNSFFCAHRLTWQIVTAAVVVAAVFKGGNNYFSSQLQRVQSVFDPVHVGGMWWRRYFWVGREQRRQQLDLQC